MTNPGWPERGIHRFCSTSSYNVPKTSTEVDVSPHLLRSLRHLEGHHVRVHLGDGSRLDGELVSAARRGAGTVWFHDGTDDRFVPVADIADVRDLG